MFEARLSHLEVSRAVHPAIESVAVHILEELREEVVWHQPKSFTPLALSLASRKPRPLRPRMIDALRISFPWRETHGLSGRGVSFVAGSVLNEARFDRRGSNTSDLDFLAIVAEHFWVENLYRFGFHKTPSNAVDICHLQHSGIFPEPWDGGRDADLILVSLGWLDWVIEKTEILSDDELAPPVNGEEPVYTILAMGFALFNGLPEHYQPLLHRFHRLYKGYT